MSNIRNSAHNLILSVNSTSAISNFTVYSTENYTLIQNGPTAYVIYVPRFSHGQGSLIIMNMNVPDIYSKPLTVYGTYDEGSVKAYYPPAPFIDILPQFAVTFEVFSLSVLAFITPFLYRHLRQNGKSNQKQRARFIYEVIKEVMEVRSHLQNNLTSKRTFKNTWNSIPYDTRLQIFNDLRDYAFFDTFYLSLSSRNEVISDNQIDDNTLRRTNGNCLSLAVNTLKNIEWKNYNISELIANIHRLRHMNSKTVTLLALMGGSPYVALPGLGHIYLRRLRRGIAILLIGHLLYVVNFWIPTALITLPYLPIYTLIIYFGLWIWSVLDARKLAKRFNESVKVNGSEPW